MLNQENIFFFCFFQVSTNFCKLQLGFYVEIRRLKNAMHILFGFHQPSRNYEKSTIKTDLDTKKNEDSYKQTFASCSVFRQNELKVLLLKRVARFSSVSNDVG